MAAISTRKQCMNDGGCKQVGVAYCEGCLRSFCGKHFSDHRRLLSEELNGIFSSCNEIKDTLNQRKTAFDSHPLSKQIDDWEKQSIINIQQRAKELRQQLYLFETENINELSQRLQKLSEQSNDAQEHDSFSETDLRQWNKTLEDLKTNLNAASNASINQNDYFPGLKNITLTTTMSKELFDQVSDSTIHIEQSGQVAICDSTIGYREIRGRNKYVSGIHKIRLYIEQFEHSWMLFGISPEATPMKRVPFNLLGTYGWSCDNFVWINGQKNRNNSNNTIEMKKNDIISLTFDCNNRTMVMTNERTNKKHELSINTLNYPLPWQLYVIVYEANCCIRILPT